MRSIYLSRRRLIRITLIAVALMLSMIPSSATPSLAEADQLVWRPRAPMLSQHRWFGAATTSDGLIHVVGGRTTNLLLTHEIYDPGTDTWTSRPGSTFPEPRSDLRRSMTSSTPSASTPSRPPSSTSATSSTRPRRSPSRSRPGRSRPRSSSPSVASPAPHRPPSGWSSSTAAASGPPCSAAAPKPGFPDPPNWAVSSAELLRGGPTGDARRRRAGDRRSYRAARG